MDQRAVLEYNRDVVYIRVRRCIRKLCVKKKSINILRILPTIMLLVHLSDDTLNIINIFID